MKKILLLAILSSFAFAQDCDKYLKNADIVLNRIVQGVSAIGGSVNTNANLASAFMKRYEICKENEKKKISKVKHKL